MQISRKETAWKKNRKFGDIKGGRRYPKITDKIFNRMHSLKKPCVDELLPIFIKDNPSKDFYFPASENEITEKLNYLPKAHHEKITHVWLRKIKKEEYESNETFQGMFICGSGVNLIVLNAFPKNLRMVFGSSKPVHRVLKSYSKWTQDLQFDDKKKIWFLQWSEEEIRNYYLNSLLLHEVGHFVDFMFNRIWSKANLKQTEDFANNYARIWSVQKVETITN